MALRGLWDISMLKFLKMLANWPLRYRRTIDPPEPPRCLCGSPYVPTAFMAPNEKGEIVEYHGLCCATKGCSGNFAERWSKEIESILENKNASL